MYTEFMMLYKRIYAPNSESDVGGGTRVLVVQNRLKNENNTNTIDRLRQIQHEII